MNCEAYAVVLAGGRGERFWPVSTTRRPKQLLSLVDDRPLITAAVERLDPLIPRERIFVITNAELVEETCNALPKLSKENVIGEPFGRDTAAAVTLGAALIKAGSPKGAFCVLTADHVIGNVKVFQNTLEEAFEVAVSSDVLLTIGMKPSFPSTGFGYIEAGDCLRHHGQVEFFKVKRFVEKPDLETATQYVNAGTFFWNSGMFVWSIEAFQRALSRHCPSLTDMMKRIEAEIGKSRFHEVLKSIYEKLEKISVDYAIMEKADNIIMAKGTFAWDDVGSWTSVENHFPKDDRGNVIIGKGEILDSSGNIIVSRDGLVALIGVDNLIVVQAGKTTLVCPKSRAQDVKAIVKLLNEKGDYSGLL